MGKTKDHPRVCGEKKDMPFRMATGRGSPPRMRGKVNHFTEELAELRITPAYAGKSRQRCYNVRPARDHPRVCGEKHDFQSCQIGGLGSPPRMRGKD